VYSQDTSFKYPGMLIYEDFICFTLEKLIIVTSAQQNEVIICILAYLFHGFPSKYTRIIIQLVVLLFNYALQESVTG